MRRQQDDKPLRGMGMGMGGKVKRQIDVTGAPYAMLPEAPGGLLYQPEV